MSEITLHLFGKIVWAVSVESYQRVVLVCVLFDLYPKLID